MRINGREIAQEIFRDLKERVEKLKKNKITPRLAIVLAGDDPASVSYVFQKQKKAEEIGVVAKVYKFPESISENKLLKELNSLNNNSSIHGVIVQRPLPEHIDKDLVTITIDPQKDVDAFHPETIFKMPLAQAVFKILERIHGSKESLNDWLKSQTITVIGKGDTGGGPTIALLRKIGVKPFVIDSKTKNEEEITKRADIIISAVGRDNILKPEMIKKGVILISVGLHRGKDDKLHGDYEEEEIKDKALFYTPSPGGVGPVNVAMLLENVVKAAEGTMI